MARKKVTNETRPETKDEWFERCWFAYNRKGAKKVALAQWRNLSDEDRKMAEKHIPYYVTTRERIYCKDFERYLRDHVFENPIFDRQGNILFDPDAPAINKTAGLLPGFQG